MYRDSFLEMENFTHVTSTIWLPEQDLNKDNTSWHANMERRAVMALDKEQDTTNERWEQEE